ncbi:DUF6056 family protein [uncultured Microscilla sp.]|uniref:DUF6056 family protein n=1 Tax=uncultured Microscilla sp. TaxID=432653 RepID=UPI00261F79B3|nr:DUF6056 family protein [uncultured Microscilla sp.]
MITLLKGLQSWIFLQYPKLLVGGLLLAVLPFVGLSFYVHPYYDDFKVYTYTQGLGFVQFFNYWYSGWTGAYTVIGWWFFANPIFYSFFAFKLIPLLYILLHWASIYALVVVLVHPARHIHQTRLMISLSFLVIYLSQAPALNQTLYWYVGATAYYLPVSFVLFFYALFIRYLSSAHQVNLWQYTGLVGLSIFIVGTTPFVIVWHVGLLGLFTINAFYKYPKHAYYLLALLLITLAMTWVNLGSTGGFVRAQALKNQLAQQGISFEQNTFKLVTLSCYFLLYHLGNWLSSSVLLLASVFFIPVAVRLEQRFNIQSKIIFTHPLLFLVSVVSMLCGFSLIVHYFHSVSVRIWNIFFLIFLINWFIFIQLIVTHYIRSQNIAALLKVLKIKPLMITLSLVWLWLLFVPSRYNIHNAYYDWLLVAPVYEKAMQNRYKILLDAQKHGKQEVAIPILSEREKSKIMFIDDISTDPNYHLNKLYGQYFGIKQVKGIK